MKLTYSILCETKYNWKHYDLLKFICITQPRYIVTLTVGIILPVACTAWYFAYISIFYRYSFTSRVGPVYLHCLLGFCPFFILIIYLFPEFLLNDLFLIRTSPGQYLLVLFIHSSWRGVCIISILHSCLINNVCRIPGYQMVFWNFTSFLLRDFERVKISGHYFCSFNSWLWRKHERGSGLYNFHDCVNIQIWVLLLLLS